MWEDESGHPDHGEVRALGRCLDGLSMQHPLSMIRGWVTDTHTHPSSLMSTYMPWIGILYFAVF